MSSSNISANDDGAGDPEITKAEGITGPRDKDARETSAGCRERAGADLLRADGMETVNGRQIFEKSAASWTKRADMLERIETGIAARLNTPEVVVELTAAETAEDLACAGSPQ